MTESVWGRRVASIAMCAILAALSACGSTKLRYAEGNTHQVRQGEVVKITIYQTKAEQDERDRTGTAAVVLVDPGLMVAGLVLEQAIGFASKELQAYLEKVAALHEAAYGGIAVAAEYDPSKDAELHIVRWVKASENIGKGAAAMWAVYDLKSTPAIVGDEVFHVVSVRPREEEGAVRIDHAAARLKDAKQPLNLDITLTFSTIAGTPGTAATGDKPGKPATAKYEALGDPMKHSLLISLGEGGLAVPQDEPIRPNPASERVGMNAIGTFVVTPLKKQHTQPLMVQVAVTEKDPSRAAKRNQELKDNVAALTPHLVEYARARAGLKEESAGDKE